MTDDSETGPNPLPANSEDEGVETRRLREALRHRLELDAEPSEPLRLGRFVVVGHLGEGGMGTVFTAFDPNLDRRVALKVLRRDRRSTDDRLRLLSEARLLAQLDHPNVVRVFEVFEHEEEIVLVMELVRGKSLAEWVVSLDHSSSNTWSTIVEAYLQAADGLVAAHAAGIVHRDFKPTNAVRASGGRVCVLDFGLAVVANAGSSEGSNAAGTPAYMAPEQRQGLSPDARADQYAFCLSLFEALTGHRNPDGPARRVPARVLEIVRTGLAERPEARHPSMRRLRERLSKVADRRRKRAMATLGVAAILGVSGAAAWFSDSTEEPPACATGRSEIAKVWSPERADALRDAFGGTESALEPFVDTLSADLDARAQTWAEAWDDACRATLVDRAQSEHSMMLQQRCLEHAREALDAAVTQGTRDTAADPRSVRGLLQLVRDLRPVEWCSDTERLQRVAALPRDGIRRAEVLQTRAELERVVATLATRPVADPTALDELIAEARRLDHAPLVARALLQQGLVLHRAGRRTEAEEIVRESIRHAVRGGDTMLEGEAWVRLAEISTWDGEHGQLEKASVALDAARVTAIRATDRFWILAQADLAEARIARLRNDDEHALALLKRSAEQFRRAAGLHTHQLAYIQRQLASVYAALGRTEDAVAAGAVAVELAGFAPSDAPGVLAVGPAGGPENEASREYAKALDRVARSVVARRQHDVPLEGDRPLLIVLVGDRRNSGPSVEDVRDVFFGPGRPNVADYFRSISKGKFSFHEAAVLEVVDSFDATFLQRAQAVGVDAEDGLRLRALALAEEAGFDYTRWDADSDGLVSGSELAVLVINETVQDAAAPSHAPCVDHDGTDVCVWVSLAGDVGMMAYARELASQLGAVGVEGARCRSAGATLMSCTGARKRRRTFNLDPWHRIQLGWAAPGVEVGESGSVELPGVSTIADTHEGSGPEYLRLSRTATGEAWIFEHRTRGAGDRNVAVEGIVAWYVRTDETGSSPVVLPDANVDTNIDLALFSVASENCIADPNVSRGRLMPMFVAGSSYRLRWADGTDTGRLFTFGTPKENGRLPVSWRTTEEPATCPGLPRQITWCADENERIYTGDFDGDGLGDILCHSESTGILRIDYGKNQRTGPDWSSSYSWCIHATAVNYVARMRKGSDDIVCHTKNEGNLFVDWSQDGVFAGADWVSEGDVWCGDESESLYFGDVDNDGDDDVFCHSSKTGRTEVMPNRGARPVESSRYVVGGAWCHGNADMLHIADVNGDGRADRICTNTRVGRIRVDLATVEPQTYDGLADFRHTSGWCKGSGRRMMMVDITDDGRADVACVGNGVPRIEYKVAGTTGRFFGSAYHRDVPFCGWERSRILSFSPGDLHGEALLCQDDESRLAEYVNPHW